VGFSKGGLGAFQLAGQLHADALVTIDASPMAQPFKEAHAQWVKNPPPFWAIHTTYAGNEGLRRVQDFNEVLTGNMHEGLANAPKAGASWRTWLDAPAELQGTQRHTWIADRASESTAIYQWLLQH
jgi:hypothetical protein